MPKLTPENLWKRLSDWSCKIWVECNTLLKIRGYWTIGSPSLWEISLGIRLRSTRAKFPGWVMNKPQAKFRSKDKFRSLKLCTRIFESASPIKRKLGMNVCISSTSTCSIIIGSVAPKFKPLKFSKLARKIGLFVCKWDSN